MLEELISENDTILKKSLPALPYSMQQLVFISMAQLLCESRSRQLEEEKYRNDNHAPTYIRLNGMVRNSKTFGNIFNCKPGSNMNPIEKCIFLE
ncbi:neprilysin-3-like [Parasteatoda tepidariorum]|uniref:neprilysin-3-like n=1 Tax=Parasteatoda tepidariorum TaxID=114398 RepID=UPI00077FAEF2